MKFLAIARMAFFRESFYRFELLFNALKAVALVFIIASVWRAVYTSRASIGGLSLDDVILYTCTAATLSLMFEVRLEHEMGDRIRSGNLALQLLKPVNFFVYGLAESCGVFAYTMIFSAVPTFVALYLLLDLPSVPLAPPLLGMVMVALGFALFFAFCHLTALTTFFTVESWAVEYLRMTLLRFFAGGFLPLTFFPDALYRVAMWLPFGYMIYYPTLALTGRLSSDQIVHALLMQVAWCAALLAANYGYWKLIVRQVAIHGG